MLPETFYTTDQIVRHASGKTHFFDRGAMRFFNSRLGGNAYRTANPFVTLFVTSERCDWGDHPRLYSVRAYDVRTGSVDTVGEFQQYATSRAANKAAKELAELWPVSAEEWHEYALALNEEYDSSKRRATARGDSGFVIYGIGATNNWIALKEE